MDSRRNVYETVTIRPNVSVPTRRKRFPTIDCPALTEPGHHKRRLDVGEPDSVLSEIGDGLGRIPFDVHLDVPALYA